MIIDLRKQGIAGGNCGSADEVLANTRPCAPPAFFGTPGLPKRLPPLAEEGIWGSCPSTLQDLGLLVLFGYGDGNRNFIKK